MIGVIGPLIASDEVSGMIGAVSTDPVLLPEEVIVQQGLNPEQGYLYGCPIHKTKHCLLQNVYSLGAPTGFSQAKFGGLTASSCFKLLKPPILLHKNLLGLRDCTHFVTNNVWFNEWDIHINILECLSNLSLQLSDHGT